MIAEKLQKAFAHLMQDGLVATARWLFTSVFYYPLMNWLDGRFDRRYGTETGQGVPRFEFDVSADLKSHARDYTASPDRSFVRFLKQQGLDYSDYTFVDLGCGKGRALLLASQFPFKKIVGVEVEPMIHAVCQKNIAAYRTNFRTAGLPIQALCMNAGAYEFPDGNILLYLNNPFDEHIMAQVVSKLRSAIDSSPRFVRVVYSHPNYVTALLTLPNIKLIREATFYCRASLNNVGRVASYEIAPFN